MLRELFSGQDGRLSSKRVIGTLAIVVGVVMDWLEKGSPEIRQALIYGGFAAIGAGVAERLVGTRSQQGEGR